MCLDACLDWERLRRLDCVDRDSVMDREINRLSPLGKVFKRAQFGDEIAPRDDTAARGPLLDLRAQINRHMESHRRNALCPEPRTTPLVQLLDPGPNPHLLLAQPHRR